VNVDSNEEQEQAAVVEHNSPQSRGIHVSIAAIISNREMYLIRFKLYQQIERSWDIKERLHFYINLKLLTF
jgi:hypothetical protein